MPIKKIHTYLVHPGKAAENAPGIGGTLVSLDGKVFHLLAGIYEKSDRECDIDIAFNQSADGTQSNECRTLIVSYIERPSLARGRAIAERLQRVTDQRSGLGLLFIIAGKEDDQHKIVISRFPADSGILAEESQQDLSVEFLERVFMKSATSYKAAVYQHASLDMGFWIGSAVDKQINSRIAELSNYWIADFLSSGFRTTSAAGTKRLAAAIRSAAETTDNVRVKSELLAAVTLASGLRGQTLSIREFADQFGLSAAATDAITEHLSHPGLVDERFAFDAVEFRTQLPFRSVELDSGGMLTAPAEEFDNVFQREVVNEAEHRVRYSAEGTVVNEKLRKTK